MNEKREGRFQPREAWAVTMGGELVSSGFRDEGNARLVLSGAPESGQIVEALIVPRDSIVFESENEFREFTSWCLPRACIGDDLLDLISSFRKSREPRP